jgi:hypothetical protein
MHACQVNIVSHEQQPVYKLVMAMPRKAEVPLGERLICQVELKHPKEDQQPVYIEPMPFKFSDWASTHRNVRYVGCKWIGLVRQRLARENGFRAEFQFTVIGAGIFDVPGFSLWPPPPLAKTDIGLSQAIRIIIVP